MSSLARKGLARALRRSVAATGMLAAGAAAAGAATLEHGPVEPAEDRLAAAARDGALRSGGAFAAAGTRAAVAAIGTEAAAAGRLTVFGDSYSRLRRKSFPNWAEQLRNEGDVSSLASFAVSGATAATVGTNNFRSQYNRWLNTSPTFGNDDITAVYFGHNDIDDFSNLTKPKNDYKAIVGALIAKGAASGDRRLLLAIPHDWSRNPAQQAEANPSIYRTRSLSWRTFIASYARNKSGVAPVDVFTAFEKIFADPARYGLDDITNVDPDGPSGSKVYLYDDTNHFGRRGQELIKQVFEERLARAADVAGTLSTGSQAAARLRQDTAGGLAFNTMALTAEERQGLTAFPVGLAALPEAETASDDLARAGFAEAYATDQQDGGVGLNYELGATRLGFVIAHYDESRGAERDASVATGGVASDSVSVYLDHEVGGGLVLSSRFAYSDDRHRHRVFDELLGEGRKAGFDGNTTEVSQRLGYPVEAAWGLTLTPWAELTHRVQKVDGFTMASPYVSDVSYAATEVGETEAALGIDARSAPIALGAGASLVLSGGLSYTHSLVRDDYELEMREEALEGFTQRETVERPELRQIGLNLGAELAVGESLAIGAGVALTSDPAEGTAEAARFSLTYRF